MKQRIFVYEHLSGGPVLEAHGEDGRSMLAQGLAMRDAICADLAALGRVAVSCASHPALGPGGPWDGVVFVHPTPGQSVLEFVRRQARAHDFAWVVAPESEGLLCRLSEAVAPSRWIGCDTAAIRLASSKRRTLELLAAHGLATPLAFTGADITSGWVVKPDDGAGAVATRRHAQLDAARSDAQQRAGHAQLEPWVEGESLSLSLLCEAEGTEVLAVNRQHIAVDAEGRVSYVGVDVAAVPANDPRTAALREVGRRVALALPGLRGYVGVDLVWHVRRGPVVIEINPRVTSAYVGLSAALGRPLAGEILSLFMPPEGRRAQP